MPTLATARRPARPTPRTAAPRPLRATVVPVASVDAGTRARSWTLFAAAYAGADRRRFESDFAAKQRVILLHDPADGSLQGFSTIHVGTVAGEHSATVVFSGDTVIAPAYWGSKALQQAFAGVLIREKLRRPGRPLYWFLISKGYKTYLMLARAFPRSVPRVDRADDPQLRAILDTVAAQRFGPAYDPRSGVIRHVVPLEAVRAGLCPVDATLLADPDIAFFVARNPGRDRGDELACLAQVRLRDCVRRIVRSALHRGRAGAARAAGARR